jgi:hypothetical protein
MWIVLAGRGSLRPAKPLKPIRHPSSAQSPVALTVLSAEAEIVYLVEKGPERWCGYHLLLVFGMRTDRSPSAWATRRSSAFFLC